jgi:hypothetical protein
MFNYLRFSYPLHACLQTQGVISRVADGTYAVVLMLLSVLLNINPMATLPIWLGTDHNPT